MTGETGRTGLAIVTDLYNITDSMARRLDDPDFLIGGVEKRQSLMDEYDAYHRQHPEEDIGQVRQMVKEIVAMDQKIGSSLTRLKGEAKRKMVDIRSRQKSLEYAEKAAPSGTFMNYTK